MREAALRPGLALYLAFRALSADRLITALMLAAIAAGVGFQVPVEANLLGYDRALMQEAVHTATGAVIVLPKGEQMLVDVGAMADKIAGYPETRAVLPVLTLPGAVRAKGKSVRCAVRGVDGGLFYRLKEGEPLREGDAEQVLVGIDMVKELGIVVGDQVAIQVILETNPTLLEEDAVGRYKMRVAGIVEGAFGARDAVFLSRKFLGDAAGRPDEAHSLSVYAHDPENADAIKARIVADYPDVDARTWVEYGAYLRANLGAINAIARVSVAMVIAAVAIPVLALLYINVLRRRREVGLAAAIGASRVEIFAVFLFQAALLGIVGVALGFGIGAGLVAWFHAHPIFEFEGFVIRATATLPSFVRPGLIVLATTLLAGTVPAWLASRIDPARVLRGTE